MAKSQAKSTEDQAAEAEPTAEQVAAATADESDADDDGDDFGADLESMYATAADTADVDPKRDQREQGESEDSEPVGDEAAASEEEPRESGEAPADTAPDATQAAQPETQPQAVVEEQPAQRPPEQPLDPQQIVAQYQQWRGQAEELLATQHYNLTEEQATELENEPAKAIPRLAARLHMEVLQQATAAAMRIIPSMMQEVTAVQSVQSQREQEFFQEWPELQSHRDDVLRFGTSYVQMNPNATFEDFKRDVGAQVAVARKVDLSARQTAAQSGNGQAQPSPPPQKPLSARSAGGAQAPSSPTNPFEQLDVEFERFEEEIE